MPLYEYACMACEVITDAVKPFPREDGPEWESDFYQTEPCKVCGCKANKIISKSNFQFACGGFYETDYKHKR